VEKQENWAWKKCWHLLHIFIALHKCGKLFPSPSPLRKTIREFVLLRTWRMQERRTSFAWLMIVGNYPMTASKSTGFLQYVWRDDIFWMLIRYSQSLGQVSVPVPVLYINKAQSSVGEPDPELHVFGPPGSGSISQRYASASGSIPFPLQVFSWLK